MDMIKTWYIEPFSFRNWQVVYTCKHPLHNIQVIWPGYCALQVQLLPFGMQKVPQVGDYESGKKFKS